MKKSFRRGFTLIELLVVIAIIGILSSIVLASLNSARQKGRDARRVSDIKQLQLALELYYDANGHYPPTLTVNNIVTPGYISTLPSDPSGATAYSYAGLTAGTVGGTCSSYHLGATLESSTHSALGADSDQAVTVNICTNSGADFAGADAGKCNAADAGAACFDVNP
jgi:prepilin-type N-terminal cleavage/methylation domain-containing protein